MNNPFLKRIMKTNSEEVMHSSVYAKAQNSGAMGAASTESFAARMKMENHRQNIRGYGDSRVVSDARNGLPKAKTYNPDDQQGFSRQRTDRQEMRNSGMMRRGQTGNMSGNAQNIRPVTPPARKNPGIFR